MVCDPFSFKAFIDQSMETTAKDATNADKNSFSPTKLL